MTPDERKKAEEVLDDTMTVSQERKRKLELRDKDLKIRQASLERKKQKDAETKAKKAKAAADKEKSDKASAQDKKNAAGTSSVIARKRKRDELEAKKLENLKGIASKRKEGVKKSTDRAKEVAKKGKPNVKISKDDGELSAEQEMVKGAAKAGVAGARAGFNLAKAGAKALASAPSRVKAGRAQAKADKKERKIEKRNEKLAAAQDQKVKERLNRRRNSKMEKKKDMKEELILLEIERMEKKTDKVIDIMRGKNKIEISPKISEEVTGGVSIQDAADYTPTEIETVDIVENPFNIFPFVRDKDGKASARRQAEIKARREKATADREARDRSKNRASEVVNKDGNSVRYTRQSDGSTRRSGQMATLGGQSVRWKVDNTGKGSWRSAKDGSPVASKPKPPKPSTDPVALKTTNTPAAPSTTPKPQLSAQDQKTNAEYDRLRKSGDMKGAAAFGMKANQAKFGKNFAKPKTTNPLMAGLRSKAPAVGATPIKVEEVELTAEAYSALVRQGIKMGGKKGGRAAQAAEKAAIEKGRKVADKAKEGNKKKMVGDGKAEKIGATVGGLTGAAAGFLVPDGPAMVAGELAGGYAGSKVGGKIGRQIDKFRVKKKEKKSVKEEASDAMKDRRMERGGVGGNQRYDKSPGAPNTFGKKKPKKGGPSAMDIVRADIEKKYGKGAIMNTKKKTKKEEFSDWKGEGNIQEFIKFTDAAKRRAEWRKNHPTGGDFTKWKPGVDVPFVDNELKLEPFKAGSHKNPLTYKGQDVTKDMAKDYAGKKLTQTGDAIKGAAKSVVNYAKNNPAQAAAIGAGVVGAGLLANKVMGGDKDKKKKEKKESFSDWRSEMGMVQEGEGKKDACYHKVKASAKVWPSAYASGRLVQCRKKGAANYGNSKKD